MNLLEQACFDIVTKNMEYTDQTLYLLFDIDSPLAKRLSEAFVKVMSEELWAKRSGNTDKIKIREFVNPPQPLYRGGLINPDNPHLKEQNRVTTSYNIEENKRVGLEHHEIFAAKMTENTNLEKALENPLTSIPQEWIETQSQEQTPLADPQIELIKEELINLEKGSIVILVQLTLYNWFGI